MSAEFPWMDKDYVEILNSKAEEVDPGYKEAFLKGIEEKLQMFSLYLNLRRAKHRGEL